VDSDQRVEAERDLAFFGVVTTSMTHELANVILIIEQVAGLLDDLLETHREGRPVSCERLAVIQERLNRQTRRASALIQNLNRFAHGIDLRFREFDLIELVRSLLAVSGRFANSRGVTVRIHSQEEEISMRSDPFAVQQAVFAGLRRAFSICGPGNTIDVTVSRERGGPTVVIEGPSGVDSSTSANQMEILQPILKKLGGSLSLRRKGTDEILTLHLGT
jgi:signal transduction histidine kinase